MIRVLGRLVLGMVLVAGWWAVAADELAPKNLTPKERQELRARWTEWIRAGGKLHQADKLVEAVQMREKALTAARRLYPAAEHPDGHPDLALSLNNLAFVIQAQGKAAAAKALYREAAVMFRRHYPRQDHPDLAYCLTQPGVVPDLAGFLARIAHKSILACPACQFA